MGFETLNASPDRITLGNTPSRPDASRPPVPPQLGRASSNCAGCQPSHLGQASGTPYTPANIDQAIQILTDYLQKIEAADASKLFPGAKNPGADKNAMVKQVHGEILKAREVVWNQSGTYTLPPVYSGGSMGIVGTQGGVPPTSAPITAAAPPVATSQPSILNRLTGWLGTGVSSGSQFLDQNPQIKRQIAQFMGLSPTPPISYQPENRPRQGILAAGVSSQPLHVMPNSSSNQLRLIGQWMQGQPFEFRRLELAPDWVYAEMSLGGVPVKGYMLEVNPDGSRNILESNKPVIPSAQDLKRAAPSLVGLALAGGGAYLLWMMLSKKKGRRGSSGLGSANLGNRPRRRSSSRSSTSPSSRSRSRSRSRSSSPESTNLQSPRRSRARSMSLNPKQSAPRRRSASSTSPLSRSRARPSSRSLPVARSRGRGRSLPGQSSRSRSANKRPRLTRSV